jgi:hypothetical protein
MAAAQIDPHWRYHDLRAIVLENARLRLTLLPEVGAKIYDFICKRSDRNFLWHFPREVFPVLWCWMVYGGWRGHYHAVLEPWTGWPHQLDKAVAAGRQRTLAPGESLLCETMAVVYSGVGSVTGIGRDGEVRGSGYR